MADQSNDVQLESLRPSGIPERDPIRIEICSHAVSKQTRGESLDLSVQITNISDGPIWMIGVVPGAEGLRYPRYVAEIEGPDGLERPRSPEDLDYVRGLRAEDFVRLEPGQSFDPQGEGFIPIQHFAWFRPGAPGRYRLRLGFDATEPDPRQWMGHTHTPDQRHVEELIQRVPPVRVWSNILEIEFQD
jgi:hypothetical protein